MAPDDRKQSKQLAMHLLAAPCPRMLDVACSLSRVHSCAEASGKPTWADGQIAPLISLHLSPQAVWAALDKSIIYPCRASERACAPPGLV